MGSRKWPLTGGLPCKLSFAADNGLERMYIAGYQDGSVRIWDATYPALSLVFAFKSEVRLYQFSKILFFKGGWFTPFHFEILINNSLFNLIGRVTLDRIYIYYMMSR